MTDLNKHLELAKSLADDVGSLVEEGDMVQVCRYSQFYFTNKFSTRTHADLLNEVKERAPYLLEATCQPTP